MDASVSVCFGLEMTKQIVSTLPDLHWTPCWDELQTSDALERNSRSTTSRQKSIPFVKSLAFFDSLFTFKTLKHGFPTKYCISESTNTEGKSEAVLIALKVYIQSFTSLSISIVKLPIPFLSSPCSGIKLRPWTQSRFSSWRPHSSLKCVVNYMLTEQEDSNHAEPFVA